MKIILAGDYHSQLHEFVLERSLKSLGNRVINFKWHPYFENNDKQNTLMYIKKFQNKYLFGPIITKINNELFRLIEAEKPDMLFIYRGTHILPNMIKKIKFKFPNILIVGYNNDDPFSKSAPTNMWRHFLNGIKCYDIMFAYRKKNIQEFKNAGCKKVFLLRSWFDPKKNFPKNLTIDEQKKYTSDVTFVGHYEPDGRLKYLEEVVRQGWNLKLFGHGYGWNKVLSESQILKSYVPVETVWGNQYNNSINGAKIALCFLSKLNNDTYTRRCFEIPASGTVLLSERTSDLSNMYAEGVDAEFFSSMDEFRNKLNDLLSNEDRLNKISSSGLRRVWKDGHDIDSRARYLLSKVRSS